MKSCFCFLFCFVLFFFFQLNLSTVVGCDITLKNSLADLIQIPLACLGKIAERYLPFAVSNHLSVR